MMGTHLDLLGAPSVASTAGVVAAGLLLAAAACGHRPASPAGDDAGRRDGSTFDGAVQCRGQICGPNQFCCWECGVCMEVGSRGCYCPDAGPPPCTSNDSCRPEEYCHQDDGHCLAARGGKCQARPGACGTIADPVCGCDGKPYGNVCAAHAAGVSVASRGACTMDTCQALESAYQVALKAAKSCCLACNSVQCETKVMNKLTCPCGTFANATDAVALQKLASLAKQAQAAGCDNGDGFCLPCLAVMGASCVPAAPGSPLGSCVDRSF